MLSGDTEGFEALLEQFMLASLSFHDPAGTRPERVHHALVLGLLVSLMPEYEVKSNREAGYGRVDILVLPTSASKPGVVIELKTAASDEDATLADALQAAATQIRQQRYVDELRARGAAPCIGYAAAFSGKRVRVERLDDLALLRS